MNRYRKNEKLKNNIERHIQNGRKNRKKKLNDDFDEFCLKIGASSALAYFAVDDNVALALHSVSDAEILNVVANLVHHLASKNNVRTSDVWQQLQQTSPEFIPDSDLM